MRYSPFLLGKLRCQASGQHRLLNEHYCSATVLTPRLAWLMAEMEGPAMALNRGNEDWRSLAEEASKEMDPAKLTILVGKLCRALR